MGVATYIPPNRLSKQGELILGDLKSKVSDAEVLIEDAEALIESVDIKFNEKLNEVNAAFDGIDNKKENINLFIVEANNRVENTIDTVNKELEVTQSDIDSILEMVGDL